ncbi:MAG: SDR family oxidoreductase [Promethearchaeia archaeon]
MDFKLLNKNAVVLASSKGLGLACAKQLYQEGANVIICSRSEKNLRKAKEEIEQQASLSSENYVDCKEVNLLHEKDIKDLADYCLRQYDTIDVLVHNAGGPPSGPVDEITKEQWTNSIRLNLRSFIRICDQILPQMQKQKSGSIITIASVSVKQPLENLVLSNTTRLGVVGYAKTIANKYAPDNIRVNVVCPGPTLTNRMKELIQSEMEQTGKPESEVKKKWTKQIPMGRLGKPEELANLVTFLASERASYISGTVIQVDGGFIKGPF